MREARVVGHCHGGRGLTVEGAEQGQAPGRWHHGTSKVVLWDHAKADSGTMVPMRKVRT